MNPLFENSGYKGRHYWVFLEEPETADVLHLFGRLLLASQAMQLPPGMHLEFFPKQARVRSKGLGNLIKLPLGIHRRTGYRSLLLDDQGQPVPDALAALRSGSRARASGSRAGRPGSVETYCMGPRHRRRIVYRPYRGFVNTGNSIPMACAMG